jgi:hypothetical protein
MERVDEMRKTMWQIPVAVITALCLAGAPAVAARARVAKATYSFDMTRGGSVWVADENAAITSGDGIVVFETARSDRMVALTVTDDAAATVSAAMWQEESATMIFCNEMAAMPITGGQPVYVQIILDLTPAPSAGCETPEVPTTGTVTASFTGGAKKKMSGHGHHHH